MDEDNLKVSYLGEKKLIKRIIAKSNIHNFPNIGDDAAIINMKSNFENLDNSYLIASSDMLIESHHFPKKMSHYQMGWKAVTVNVSDLAAMGAIPLGFLMNIAIPSNMKLSDFDYMIDGVLDACSYYKIPLIGGDTNQGDEIIISGTSLGKTHQNTLRKYGFKKGDLIGVTDKLGLSALGFQLISQNNDLNQLKEKNTTNAMNLIDLAIEKSLKPIAKINEGITLSNEKIASSATDITDGLASELYELYDGDKTNNPNSKLGIKIYEEKLKDSNFYKLSKLINYDPLDLILNFGEDFELLFTVNPDDYHKLKNIKINSNDFNFYIIGEITDSNKVEIELLDGDIKKLSSKGYEHLSN